MKSLKSGLIDLNKHLITRGKLDTFILSEKLSGFSLEVGASGTRYDSIFEKVIKLNIIKTAGVWAIGDAHKLPFKNESFDNVAAFEVLEHLTNPQNAVAEFYRVLKKGGMLILSARFLFPIHDAPYDYFRFTKYGLRELLKDFKEVEIRSIDLPMEALLSQKSRLSFEKSIPAFLRAINFAICIMSYPLVKICARLLQSDFATSGYYVKARKK